MKRILLILLVSFLSASAYAQVPQKMSYQAIIRNESNVIVSSSTVGIKISVVKASPTGEAIFVESHTKATNANGLISLEIGAGLPIFGLFASIDWSTGPYFIKTDADITGGSNYSISGTTELMSVPYALFSANGTPGPKGERGEAGPQGIPGGPGSKGIAGSTGPQGPAGSFGSAGPQGPTGSAGPMGARGPQGISGINGSQGLPGPIGPAGLTWKGNWSTTGSYNKDDVVGFNGASWFCLKAVSISGSIPSEDDVHWALLTSQGATGPQGFVGLTGATGAQGPRGLPGPSGTDGALGATGPSGPAGNEGVAGAIGPQGLVGNVGATGPQGPAGLAGSNGSQGPAGPTGATGPQGVVGIAGVQGQAGPVGPAGLTWRGIWTFSSIYVKDDVVSFNGTSWFCIASVSNSTANPSTDPTHWALLAAQGAIGPQGPTGLKGQSGIDGLAGVAGPQGPIGITGLTGATGDRGPIGLTGLIGNNGPTGAPGPQGPIGLTGANGAIGPHGPIGNDGAPGADGSQGPRGITGPAGAQGGMGPIGVQGIAGPPGPAGLTWRGSWSFNGSYLKNDLVSFNGSSWYCIVTVSNSINNPSNDPIHWGLLAAAGATGAMGPIGLTGPEGSVGALGPVGPSGIAASSANFVDLSSAQSVAGIKIFSSVISGSITGNAGTVTNGIYTTNKLNALSATTSTEFSSIITDETGSGNLVFALSPTLVSPVLGAATGTSLVVSGQLTSSIATGTAPLVIASTTPVANLSIGGNAATVTNGVYTTNKLNTLAATTSAEFSSIITDETGSGNLVFALSPTLVSPVLGEATGTSLVVSGQLASSVTTGTAPLVIASTTPVANLSIGGNAATVTNGIYTTNKLNALSATTSAEFSSIITDETGSGNLVFASSPTLVSPVLGAATGTSLVVSGQLTSSIATGTAPLVINSTTPVANLSIGGTATNATNLVGGSAGSIPYQSGSSTTTLLTRGTNGQVLTLMSGIPSWASSSSGGITSLSTIGGTPNTSGGTVTETTLQLHPASATTGGVITNGAQTFGGVKTFNQDIVVSGVRMGGFSIGNTRMGEDALFGGNYNSAFGYHSLKDNRTPSGNSAFGYLTLTSNDDGNNNVAVGSHAMNLNRSGGRNVAVGVFALRNNTLGSGNTAVGYYTLQASTGSGSTAVGYEAGENARDGQKNIFIGYQAGKLAGLSATNISGINSVMIGYDTRPLHSGTENEIVISGWDKSSGTIGLGSNTTLIGASTTIRTQIMGALNLPNATSSTSNSTGALTVKGGVGIEGALNVGGNSKFTGTIEIDGGSPANGKLLVSDAGGVAKWSYSNGAVVSISSTAYTITLAESHLFYTGSAAGSFSIPAAVIGNAGKELLIKNKTAFDVTITPVSGSIYLHSGSTSASSVTLGHTALDNWLRLVSDGSQWNVLY